MLDWMPAFNATDAKDFYGPRSLDLEIDNLSYFRIETDKSTQREVLFYIGIFLATILIFWHKSLTFEN